MTGCNPLLTLVVVVCAALAATIADPHPFDTLDDMRRQVVIGGGLLITALVVHVMQGGSAW